MTSLFNIIYFNDGSFWKMQIPQQVGYENRPLNAEEKEAARGRILKETDYKIDPADVEALIGGLSVCEEKRFFATVGSEITRLCEGSPDHRRMVDEVGIREIQEVSEQEFFTIRRQNT